jgi:hypothetical protein
VNFILPREIRSEATEAIMTKVTLLLAIVALCTTPAWAEGPATPDACRLVTGADVTAALGSGFQLVDNPLAAKPLEGERVSRLSLPEGGG